MYLHECGWVWLNTVNLTDRKVPKQMKQVCGTPHKKLERLHEKRRATNARPTKSSSFYRWVVNLTSITVIQKKIVLMAVGVEKLRWSLHK